MNSFFAETTVRWSDLDANRHLANASYMNFTSYARISYLRKFGVTMQNLEKWNIGPAVLREEFSFFREAHDGQEIVITVQQTGISEKGEMFEFEHNLYLKEDGTHLAYSKVFGVWFSMDKRKITPPPAEMLEKLSLAIDPENIRKLTMDDIKKLPVKPENIDPKMFTNA